MVTNSPNKMPKPSRDQQFQKSFEVFFEDLTDNYPNLTEYTLTNTTENKTCCDHTYTLHIPRQIVAYHLDLTMIDRDGIEIGPGPVMKNQEIPNKKEFKKHYNDYFKDYQLEIGKILVSYTEIYDFWYEKEDVRITNDEIRNGIIHSDLSEYDVFMKILVVYHKTHFPFPIPLTNEEKLEKRCRQLQTRNNELVLNLNGLTNMYQEKEEQNTYLRHRLRVERRIANNKYKAMIEKMQKKFSEYYDKLVEKDECPVCYEEIIAEKLKVPGCCHSICKGCAEKCDKCPICRESYL